MSIEPKLTVRSALRQVRLGRLLWQERRALLPAISASVIGPVLAMAMPFAAKLVIDDVIGRGRSERLLPIGLLAGLGVVAQAGVAYGAAQFGALAGQRVTTRLQQRLQRHVLRLPVRFFHAQQSGALVSRILNDTEQVRSLLSSGVLQLLSGALSGAVAFAVLAYINWKLAAATAATLTLVTLGLSGLFLRLHPAFHAAAELQAALAGRLTQLLGGILVVKSCSAERREGYRFARESHRLLRVSVTAQRQVSVLMAAMAVAQGGVCLMLLILGGRAVSAGAMTLGDLALFVVLAGLLGTPVVQAAAIASELGRALAALARIGEVLTLPTEETATVRTLPAPSGAPRIVFDDVTYSYRAGMPVLRGVTFSAAPGTVTALTGPNGAGKSTLLGLLMGVDSPSAGRILLDGRPLGQLRLAEYRKTLGVVLQRCELFEGTIEENIRYGRPGATAEEFRRAARLACCDQLVESLPQGYRTLVGERGVRLSGGQRQRVAIARAILADPRILLLDEAGSQLDQESERLLQDAVMALCEGRTTLVVTHRLATVRRADQILVLRGGTIVERADGGLHAAS